MHGNWHVCGRFSRLSWRIRSLWRKLRGKGAWCGSVDQSAGGGIATRRKLVRHVITWDSRQHRVSGRFQPSEDCRNPLSLVPFVVSYNLGHFRVINFTSQHLAKKPVTDTSESLRKFPSTHPSHHTIHTNNGTKSNSKRPNRQTHSRRRASLALAARRSSTRFQRCKEHGFLQSPSSPTTTFSNSTPF
jgi:hypothetical protein